MKRAPCLVLCTVLAAGTLNPAHSQDDTVSLDDVLLLARSGISEQTIRVFLQRRRLNFVLDAEGMLQLRAGGQDEGRVRTVEARGNAVVRNLEEAKRMAQGRFKVLHADGVNSIVYHSGNLRELPIITVNHRDVFAYDVRSERRVTLDLLTHYWIALLNDYWAIAFRNRPPDRLAEVHRGDALMLLFNIVNEGTGKEPRSLTLAVQQLPGPIRSHLERLATAVPGDFNAPFEHLGDQP